MSSENGKTYRDPVKRIAREKVREFIANAYPNPKRRKDLTVLCFPGAEVVGEEALEVRHIYDQLGIPRRNITGLEYDRKKALRLKDANLGIEVVSEEDWKFLQDTDRTFDIISLDYTTYFRDSQRFAIDLISARALLGSRGVLVTNYFGAREGADEKELLTLNERFAKAGLSLADVDRIGFHKAVEISKEHEVELRDTRSKTIQQYIVESLDSGRLSLDSLGIRRLFDPDYIKEQERIINQIIDEAKKEGDKMPLGRNGVEIGARVGTTHYRNKKEINELLKKLVKNKDFTVPLAFLLQMELTRPYVLEAHESYSYVSNKSSPMLLDLWLLNNFTNNFPRNIFTITPSKMQKNPDDTYKCVIPAIVDYFVGLPEREVNERLERLERGFEQIIIPIVNRQPKISILERQFLGSSYTHVPKQDRQARKDKITKEEAIELLASGVPVKEIADAFSGYTERQLAAFKAHITMGTYDQKDNGEDKK